MKKTTGIKLKLRTGEKLIIGILTILVVMLPLTIVYTTASLSSSNLEVERLKEKIEKQNNINASLSMQVDELASLSNIQNIAKEYGLSYNNDSIIVIK